MLKDSDYLANQEIEKLAKINRVSQGSVFWKEDVCFIVFWISSFCCFGFQGSVFYVQHEHLCCMMHSLHLLCCVEKTGVLNQA